MFAKLARSWDLVKASAAVLKADKELLLFPVLSGFFSLLVAASFFVPAIAGGFFERAEDGQYDPALLAFGFAFYVVQYFVIIFFNSALVGAAMIRLRGGDPTVADGLRIAGSKWVTILGYAVISATVGMILRALQERAGFIGRWVVGLIGLAWTAATFLAVPVLVNRDVGPLEAVKQSASLLKRTWGENIAGNVGIGLTFALLMFVTILAGGGLVALIGNLQLGSGLVLGVIALAVFAVVLLVLLQAALQGIYAAAVYRYAEEGAVSGGFDQDVFAEAFQPKR